MKREKRGHPPPVPPPVPPPPPLLADNGVQKFYSGATRTIILFRRFFEITGTFKCSQRRHTQEGSAENAPWTIWVRIPAVVKRFKYMDKYLEGIFGEGVVCPNRGNKIPVQFGSGTGDVFASLCSLFTLN